MDVRVVFFGWVFVCYCVFFMFVVFFVCGCSVFGGWCVWLWLGGVFVVRVVVCLIIVLS